MALVVETGAGVTSADSYISQANATTWIAANCYNPGYTEWTAADSDTKDKFLRTGRFFLDEMFRYTWRGTKYDADYELSWPRTSFYNSSGHEVDSTDSGDGIPVNIGYAQAWVAWRASKGDIFFPTNENAAAKSKSWSNQSESGSEVFVGGGASKDMKSYPILKFLLSEYLQSGFAVERC